MDAQTRRSLNKYFLGYRALVGRQHRVLAESHKGLTQFLSRLRKARPRLEQSRLRRELLVAPHFNIFRVLPIERRETVLHSPMLGHLLDPSGSHGQGCLFLREFFKLAVNCGLSLPQGPLCPAEWSVRPEVYTSHGIIDLVIECHKQAYVVVIENKIDAAEQHAQLARYTKWLHEERAEYTKQLVFLTPKGHSSELNPELPCTLLSYHTQIRELLRRTIPKVRPLRVRQTLSQYEALLNDWSNEEHP